MMATPDDPHLYSNLKRSHGLLSDMMSIISKYDKEFPDSDVVDLKDLSVSESYGFLESLPSRQTVWKEEDQIDPIRRVTVDLKKSDIIPKSVLSATALDSFLEGVIEEETLLTNQLEDEEWEDINSTIEEEKEEEQGEEQENEVIDSSDDTLSIASGSVSVRNLSEDVTEIDTGSKKVVEEESNEKTQDEISSMSLNASQSAVYVKKGQSQTEEEEFDNQYCPGGNLHRFHDRSFKDNPVDDHENDKITTDEVFHKEMRSDDQSRIESESDQMMRVRTCFLGKRKRKPFGGDEGSPSKSSRVGVSLSPRSGNTKIHSSPSSRFGLSPRSLPVDVGEMESPMRNTYVIPTTLPESPSSRMLIESWKSQLCIVSPSWNDPVRIPNDPVTPPHRGTPRRYFKKDSKGSSSYNIRTPTRSYRLGTPRDLYKSKQQPKVEGYPLAGNTFIVKEPHQRNADKIYSGRRSGDEESGEYKDEEGSSLLTHRTNDQKEAARYKDQKEEVGFLVTSGSSDEEGEATHEAEEEVRCKDQKEEGSSLVTSGSSDEEGEATYEEEEKKMEARYKNQEEGSTLVTSDSSDEEGEATYEEGEKEEEEEKEEETRYKDQEEEGISLVTSGSSDEEDEEEASSMMASDEYSRLRERSIHNQTDHLRDVEGKRLKSRLTERQERRMRKRDLNMTYVVHGSNCRRTKGHDCLKSERQESRETLQQSKRKERKDRNRRSTPTRREHQPWESCLGSPLDQTKLLNTKNIKRAGKCEIKLTHLASVTDEQSLFADPFEFHDAETLPKTFTPQHNSTMIASPLDVANTLHGSPRMLTSDSGFKLRLHSCVTQVRKDNSAIRLRERVLPQGIDNHNDSVLPTAKRKTRRTKQEHSRVEEVEDETLVRRKQMQPKSNNHGDRDGGAVNRKSVGVPHNQSNCTKIFCLRCCHSPGK
ncbi:uncharacterized protein [Apostichopus japonicus]|uniref:uncharacterized protein n=1 Tax=Stichopus japonicus TaxID=307972 RepID=UPI003AB6CFB3